MRAKRTQEVPAEAKSPETESRQLADLGEQLRRQADRLASRYPAPSASIIAPAGPTNTPFGSSHFVALTIAALAIASITPYFWQSDSDGSPAGNGTGSVALIIEQPDSKQLESERAFDFVEADVLTGAAAHPAAFLGTEQDTTSFDSHSETPVVLLDVSDPELEGLLDLWEQEGTGPTSLSI